MKKIVIKKIHPQYFDDVVKHTKTFELRKDEDDIQPGDVLVLKEYVPRKGYTGREVAMDVTYVLRDCSEYGLADDYCVIGIQPQGWWDKYTKQAM